MQTLKRIFSRKWILTTLLVLAGMAVTARLGIWQLDRLEQRRAFNSQVITQTSQAPLDLQQGIPSGLEGMEYRAVRAQGEYDFANQVALRNQSWGNEWGVHLITPLVLSGSGQVVLVDRGWIPAADFESGDWSKYDQPGPVEVQGMIRAARQKADFGSRSDPTPAPGQAPLKAWNFVNTAAIQEQLPYQLLPVYIQLQPSPEWSSLPYRSVPELEVTEGPHMSYALQWFSFAILLGVGYPFFIRWQEKRLAHNDSPTAEVPEAYR
jgi:surfeit locus 1 family protein